MFFQTVIRRKYTYRIGYTILESYYIGVLPFDILFYNIFVCQSFFARF